MKTKEEEGQHIESKADNTWGRFFVIIILAVAVSLAIYFYSENKKTQAMLKNPNQAAQAEVKSLTAKVAALMELPSDEQPTVATVSDKTKLADQPFFKHAVNGDKVLIYTQNKKAILYRPSTNKIIEVAPINIADITPTKAPMPTEVVPTIKTKIKTSPTPASKETPTEEVTPQEK